MNPLPQHHPQLLYLLCLAIVAGTSLMAPMSSPAQAHERARASMVAVSSDSTAVANAVDRFHQALASADSATAMDLLAPDAIVLESGGMETREEYRSHHLSADIVFAQAVARARGPLRVVVRGDVAWVASTSTINGEYRGQTIDSTGAELMVLTRRSDAWQISAIHWSSRSRKN